MPARFGSITSVNRAAIASLVVLLSAALAFLASHYMTPVRVVENRMLDARLALLAIPRPQSANIVVITITDETLVRLPYRSPLDRALLSDLLETLQEKGVAAIGLDVLFDRPTERQKDARLYDTLRELRIPIVAAALSERDGLTPGQAAYSRAFLEGIERGLAVVYRDGLDDTVREQLLLRREDGEEMLGFAAAISHTVGVQPPRQTRLLIDYRAGPDMSVPAFAVYPAHTVAAQPAEQLAGRIALIGSDFRLSERHRTPFAAVPGHAQRYMPGVLIEAHALSQILEGRTLRTTSAGTTYLLLLIAASLGLLVATLRIGHTGKVVLALGVIPIAWIAAFALYVYGGPLMPLIAPTIAFLLAAIASFTWQWRDENLRRQGIHRAFGRFLAPTVVDQLMQEPERLEFSGESRELTFLFTDIQDFTALTEQIAPDALVKLVNAYLDEACGIVVEHGGTIDKIVGDALHVMFNAPLQQPDHAQRAVDCALALDKWAQDFSARQAQQGLPLGVTRIGVNTGMTVVGNFGGARRFDYTAHGDAINTAARLESVNQRLGTRVCVSKTTASRCTGITFQPIANLVLKGKTEGVVAYLPIAADAVDQAFLEAYSTAYALLENASPQAGPAFEELQARYPDDPIIAMHARRLAAGQTDAIIMVRRK
ncbi:MAG: adenylate/guanylate cyclase domain-containing protein [Gammaproteobacteria bacterium]|nr:adenylate/guanylate cyclase domain-containing protein [Gammaproteobacteria bacterium]